MEASEIIDNLIAYSTLSAKAFSEKIGLENPQAVYDIQKGRTKNISQNMANKILSVYPEINRCWLIVGEGDMIKKSHIEGDNKGVVGDNNNMSNIISGDRHKGNIGNSGGNNISISLPEKGKVKIINDKGTEITCDSWPSDNTRLITRIAELEKEVESYKDKIVMKDRLIEANEKTIKANERNIDSLEKHIDSLKIKD